MATFAAYGLGIGLMLALLTISVAIAKSGLVRAFRSLMPKMNRISGVLLIVAGLFVTYYAWTELKIIRDGSSNAVFDWLNDAQSSMQRWVESVGAARLALGSIALIIAAVVASVLIGSNRNQSGPGSASRDSMDTDRASAATSSEQSSDQ